jgi:hypothetical protein
MKNVNFVFNDGSVKILDPAFARHCERHGLGKIDAEKELKPTVSNKELKVVKKRQTKKLK